MSPALRRSIIALIGALAIGVIIYSRKPAARLDGVWRTNYMTDSALFAFSLTLVEDDSGNVTGIGGIRNARTSPAFTVHGLTSSSSVALVLAPIGGDTSVFQATHVSRDTLVGVLYRGQKKPPQVLVLARASGTLPPADSR